MEPPKPEPRLWAIVTILVAVIGCLGLMGQSLISILPDLLKQQVPGETQTPNELPAFPPPTATENASKSLSALALHQDGYDYAVSGCKDGTMGKKGVTDNHINLIGAGNLEEIENIEIRYGELDHWQYPCQFPSWELIAIQGNDGSVDLFFEPEGNISKEVIFEITVVYKSGETVFTTVEGFSGNGW